MYAKPAVEPAVTAGAVMLTAVGVHVAGLVMVRVGLGLTVTVTVFVAIVLPPPDLVTVQVIV